MRAKSSILSLHATDAQIVIKFSYTCTWYMVVTIFCVIRVYIWVILTQFLNWFAEIWRVSIMHIILQNMIWGFTINWICIQCCIISTQKSPAGTYPHQPSCWNIFGAPTRNVFANPGCVWMRTLTASIGHRAMSAKNSAEALAARYSDVLHT